MKFPINTTKIAQYAALAANNSCLAALVSNDMAALNNNVNTINTPTALSVSLLLIFAAATTDAELLLLLPVVVSVCSGVLVS